MAGLALVGCGDDSTSLSAWCRVAASGAVAPLDSPEAADAWSRLESSAPSDLRPDVERVRVAAQQVEGSDPDDLTAAARLVLTPRVVEAHGRIVDAIRSRCRIDVSDMSVIDQR